jgi:miniconductance mechanosensitive channel
MKIIYDILNDFLLSRNYSPTASSLLAGIVEIALVVLLALALCIILSFVAKKVFVSHSHHIKHKEIAHNFIRSILRLVFWWTIGLLTPDTLYIISPTCAIISKKILSIVTVAVGANSLSHAITWLQSIAHVKTGDKTFSSKTFAQLGKIIIWAAAAVIIVSTIVDKSPTFVLSGLGALTAVLMLIFRDSILGLVAGVQVAQNDMVRVGDWITMQRYNADGTVIDIALTTVKVRNFDNTVTMIPSSALISDAFINWRYMSTSKGRRIKRPIWISARTVRELTEKEKENLVKEGLLNESDKPVSNLAAFEMWLRRMLLANDDITKDLTCMIRQTEASDTGIPVEVYCFTKTRDWVEYETIQTDIFDKIFVAVPKFALQIFQRTSDK